MFSCDTCGVAFTQKYVVYSAIGESSTPTDLERKKDEMDESKKMDESDELVVDEPTKADKMDELVVDELGKSEEERVTHDALCVVPVVGRLRDRRI